MLNVFNYLNNQTDEYAVTSHREIRLSISILNIISVPTDYHNSTIRYFKTITPIKISLLNYLNSK